jgi:hypothetical protein
VTVAVAELTEDGGAASAGDEFFRSPQFLAAEQATHTLRVECGGVELKAPLVVREIEGTSECDGVSPYGYPGFAAPDGVQLDPSSIDFSATGLVSVFIRHVLGPSPLAGATERNIVQIADPALPPKSRPGDRRQVRRNLEAGYTLDLVSGPESTPGQRAAFLDAYEQTMRRTGAAQHYFFGAGYFDRVFAADRTWLALATAPTGEVAAASIAAASDGYLHYYLSGSADPYLRDSPMKNVVARLIEHSQDLGLPLNLGGGMTAGDALEEFKRGFANRRQAWLTSELICDEEKYSQLSAGRRAGGFFPAYRG